MKTGEDYFFLNRESYYEMGAVNGAVYNLYTGDVFAIESPLANILELFENKGLSINEAIRSVQSSKNVDEKAIYEQLKQLEKLDLGEFHTNRIFVEKLKPENTKRNRLTEGTSLQLEMLWLKITNSCDLRCIHCCEPDGTVAKCGCSVNGVKPEDSLTVDEFKKIIDDAKLFNCREIRFIGGEPLLRKNDLISLIKYARQIEIPFLSVVTNGILFDSEVIDKLADHKVHFKILFHSHNESIHDSMAGMEGSYRKVLAAIKKIKEKNYSMDVNIIVTKHNQGDLKETIGFLKQLGIEKIQFQVLKTEREEVFASAMKTALFKTTAFFPKVRKDQFFLYRECSPCWLGKLSVDSNGDVFPCLMNQREFIGNVRKMPLANILREFQQIEKYWYLTKDNVDVCKDCEFRYACVDCRLTDSMDGSLTGGNKYCRYNPASGEWVS